MSEKRKFPERRMFDRKDWLLGAGAAFIATLLAGIAMNSNSKIEDADRCVRAGNTDCASRLNIE